MKYEIELSKQQQIAELGDMRDTMIDDARDYSHDEDD